MSGHPEVTPWARRLKIRHLEVVVVLHETGSLTGAAERLHMTQPALSHWLADLEGAVGTMLFVRGRRLVPTREGEVLISHARRMLGDVARTEADLDALRHGLQGRLHVGTGLPRVLLPRAIARWRRSRPEVFVTVVEASLPELLQRLARREIDVVIGALGPQTLRSGFATRTLMRDHVQVVAPLDHPLRHCDHPQWREAVRHPWLLPPRGSLMRDAFDRCFGAHEMPPPQPCVEAGSSIRAQLLAEGGDWLSILSATEVQLYRQEGRFDALPLTPEIASPDLGMVWEPARETAMLSAFLEVLVDIARDEAAGA